VTGLTLSQDLDDLAILYLATVQAIAFGTRFIIEAMQAAGHSLSTLFLCGGLSKNPLFVQMHADITGMPVVLSQEVESVLVGAAVLGACASGDFTSVQDACSAPPRLEEEWAVTAGLTDDSGADLEKLLRKLYNPKLKSQFCTNLLIIVERVHSEQINPP
ncbi:hypothetical protein A6R68_01564, partial [Neotoma lepida]